MSDHLAGSTLVSGDHSMQHLICVKGAIQDSGQMDGRQCQSNPSHLLVIQTMPNAVVGVIGKVVGANDNLAAIGITCALCHSTVDMSFSAPGIPAGNIGKRLDGWPNLDLNAGAIIALSPAITDKSPYLSWGRGKFDPRLHAFDGKKFIPLNSPTLPVIPPAYGLQGVGFETFTGDGPISYWNNYVAVTEMGGHGDFIDARIGLRIIQKPDLVASKLPALLAYQLSLLKPPPPTEIDAAAAARGQVLFMWCGAMLDLPYSADVYGRAHRC